MFRFLLTALLCCCIWLGLANPAHAVANYTKFPDPVPKPEVDMSFHLGAITAIDGTAEFWSGSGYLVYTWRDSRVKDGTYELSEIWHPAVEIVNASEFTLIGSGASAKDGVVTAQERVKFSLATGFNLKKFPFDHQDLHLVIESLQSYNVTFVNKSFTVAKDNFSSLSEWTIAPGEVTIKPNLWPPDGQLYSRLIYRINAKRNAVYYVTKIMLPITALTGASFLVFLLPIADLATQISIALTTILSSLTLWLLSSDNLARVAYATTIDRYVFWSLLHNSAVLTTIVVMHSLLAKDIKYAGRLFFSLRFVFPLVYFLVICSVLWRI